MVETPVRAGDFSHGTETTETRVKVRGERHEKEDEGGRTVD